MAAAQSAPRKRDKGKGKAAPAPVLPEAERDAPPRSCSDGLAASERADMANAMGMAGHRGSKLALDAAGLLSADAFARQSDARSLR